MSSSSQRYPFDVSGADSSRSLSVGLPLVLLIPCRDSLSAVLRVLRTRDEITMELLLVEE
jgi:hypothetical protein